MKDAVLTPPTTLEVHYHLFEGSHSMDAFVRNKCETELLAVFKEICVELGVSPSLETGVFEEGGLREYWKLLGDNALQIGAIAAVATAVFTYQSVQNGKPDTELVELQKEHARVGIEDGRLSIEKQRLEIQKLEGELKTGKIQKETLGKASSHLLKNPKIVTRKSNFYRQLMSYEKVTAIEFQPLDENGKKIIEAVLVNRSSFSEYVLASDVLPIETVSGAIVEIVAPVLKKGKTKWKGIFKKEPIQFSMKDKIFKDSVLQQEVSFQNGSWIECDLEIERKLDELGNVVVTGYNVVLVSTVSDGVTSKDTSHAVVAKAKAKFIEGQGSLSLEDNA